MGSCNNSPEAHRVINIRGKPSEAPAGPNSSPKGTTGPWRFRFIAKWDSGGHSGSRVSWPEVIFSHTQTLLAQNFQVEFQTAGNQAKFFHRRLQQPHTWIEFLHLTVVSRTVLVSTLQITEAKSHLA